MSSVQSRTHRPTLSASAGQENLLLDIAEVSLCGSRASSGRFSAALRPRGAPRSPVGGGSTPKNDAAANAKRGKLNEATPGMFELDDADEPSAERSEAPPAHASFAQLPGDDSSSRFGSAPHGTSWLDGGATSSALSTNTRPSVARPSVSSASFALPAAGPPATSQPQSCAWSYMRRNSAAPPAREIAKKLSFSDESSRLATVTSTAESPRTDEMTPQSYGSAVARPLSWE